MSVKRRPKSERDGDRIQKLHPQPLWLDEMAQQFFFFLMRRLIWKLVLEWLNVFKGGSKALLARFFSTSSSFPLCSVAFALLVCICTTKRHTKCNKHLGLLLLTFCSNGPASAPDSVWLLAKNEQIIYKKKNFLFTKMGHTSFFLSFFYFFTFASAIFVAGLWDVFQARKKKQTRNLFVNFLSQRTL